jgi:hypothetical protein
MKRIKLFENFDKSINESSDTKRKQVVDYLYGNSDDADIFDLFDEDYDREPTKDIVTSILMNVSDGDFDKYVLPYYIASTNNDKIDQPLDNFNNWFGPLLALELNDEDKTKSQSDSPRETWVDVMLISAGPHKQKVAERILGTSPAHERKLADSAPVIVKTLPVLDAQIHKKYLEAAGATVELRVEDSDKLFTPSDEELEKFHTWVRDESAEYEKNSNIK